MRNLIKADMQRILRKLLSEIFSTRLVLLQIRI